MSLEKIIDALEADERLNGWQLRETRKRSLQLYANPKGDESRRDVDSLYYEIEVLVRRKGGPKKDWVTGNAKFVLDSEGLGRLDKELNQACAAAQLIENEAYSMTEVTGLFPQVQLADPALTDPKKAMAALAESAAAIRAGIAKEKGSRFSALEVFVDHARLRHINSQGVQAMQESTLISGEFILLSQGSKAGQESEVFRAFKRRRAQDLDLSAWVAEAAETGRQRVVAALPKTGGFDVVFSGEALDHFFSWFTAQASAAAKYNRMSQFELGQDLAMPEPGASPLTLWHNALLPWAVGSYKVDPSGSAGQRRLLIEKGRLKARWASARYAQYLKVQPTGELANIEVEPGRASEAELLKADGSKPLYHLRDFSYFEPNSVTGEFSAEIRAGAEITAKGRRPIRGGSVSGLSAEAVAGAILSAALEQRERYLGPAMIRCPQLTLAGD